jgi:hypothetical protein
MARPAVVPGGGQADITLVSPQSGRINAGFLRCDGGDPSMRDTPPGEESQDVANSNHDRRGHIALRHRFDLAGACLGRATHRYAIARLRCASG